MQLFDRGRVRVPVFLNSARVRAARRAYLQFYEMQTDLRAQHRPPEPTSLRDPTVGEQLEKLFHGKCAFCEERRPTEPYRFRPPVDAAPLYKRRDGHLYYGWLAEVWDNVYAICEACAPEDPTNFPVRSRRRATLPTLAVLREFVESDRPNWAAEIDESPVFLDPCRQASLAPDLRFSFDGTITGATASGRRTIRHFNLDRPQLTERRAEAFRGYFNELLGLIEGADGPLTLDFQRLEFGGGWWLLLRRMLAPLAPGGLKSLVSQAAVQRLLQGLQGASGAFPRLLELKRDFEVPPPNDVAALPQPALRRGDAELRGITIRRFKGIEALDLRLADATPRSAFDDDLWRPTTPALLLLGENATGKSSALESIALAMTDPHDLTRLKVKLPQLLFDPSQVGEGRGAKARSAEIVLRFSDGPDHEVELTGTQVLSPDGDRVPPVFAYGAFRQFGEGRVGSRISPVGTLFDTTALLPNPEAWLGSLNPDDFEMVARELRWILAVDGDYDVIQPRGGRYVVVTRTPGAGGRLVRRYTPFSAVSSGFRSVLGMACNIMQGLMSASDFKSFSAARGVVLIDEIEAHLHPRWKLQVMRGLRRVFPLMTFIVTSHDPLCLRGMEPNEVVVLNRVASEGRRAATTKIQVVTDLPDIGQLTIDQLLTSDLFRLFSSDTPQTEHTFARVADLLVRRREGGDLSPEDNALLDAFQHDVAIALPVGATEVQRVVQDAVASYLRKRETALDAQLKDLRDETRKWIVEALEGERS